MFIFKRKSFYFGLGFLFSFVSWTLLLGVLDRGAIGPLGSVVGLSGLNGGFRELVGVNMTLYFVTDLFGILPILVACGFGALGLLQWIRRGRLFRVDRDILALGVFYIFVFAVYALFEVAVINYRPVLIDGALEASYPSSTTMLSMCVLPTAIMQLKRRVRGFYVRWGLIALLSLLLFALVVGRILSGVHWITDIVGAALFSAGAVCLYAAVFAQKRKL